MEILRHFFHYLSSPKDLIEWGGYLVLVAIVFAETGLFVGFFLPGDSLLVMAGLFAARGNLNLAVLIVSLCLAAIAGHVVGYWFGRTTGARLFARSDSRLFKREHLLKAQAFYEKHGTKTIILARFIPVIRTFAPIVAGAAGMEFRRFMLVNVAGGIGWVTSMCLLGYLLGNTIPPKVMDRYVYLVIGVIIVLSVLPGIIHLLRERRTGARHEASGVREDAARELAAAAERRD
jgi:membrane-associated protein